MYPNPLKQKLRKGEIVLGTSLPVPSSLVLGTIVQAQPDFVWIDTEHAPFATESLDAIPVLARQNGVAPMIRVAWNDPALIKKAYRRRRCGRDGAPSQYRRRSYSGSAYARYPPEGQRGLSPMWTRIAGEDWNHVIKTANAETVLILQVESHEAYDNIDEIKQVAGIDVLLVGPLDLSASVGKITETSAREVQEIMQDVPGRLEGSGIVAGTTLVDLSEIQEKLRWGYRFMNVGNILAYGTQVLTQNLETLRANPGGGTEE